MDTDMLMAELIRAENELIRSVNLYPERRRNLFVQSKHLINNPRYNELKPVFDKFRTDQYERSDHLLFPFLTVDVPTPQERYGEGILVVCFDTVNTCSEPDSVFVRATHYAQELQKDLIFLCNDLQGCAPRHFSGAIKNGTYKYPPIVIAHSHFKLPRLDVIESMFGCTIVTAQSSDVRISEICGNVTSAKFEGSTIEFYRT